MKAAKKKGFFHNNQLALMIAGIALAMAVIFGAIFCLQTYGGEQVSLGFDGRGTNASLRDTLKARLGSALGTKTYLLFRLQGGDAATLHGGYSVNPGQTAIRIARNLAKGYQTPVRVTFNNVRTLDQLADRVTRNLEMTPADFMSACDSVLGPKGFTREEYPAAFVPDSYDFYRDVSPRRLVERLFEYRNKFWNPARIAKATALGLDPAQVAAIASIVEEETAKSDERPKVARLYLNRLARGMKLQADPTVKFALGDFSIRRLTQAMTRHASPYNTYYTDGLPPGPIRVADKQTIDDVLDAPQHDYLYMCAREDFSGYHNFATDYATHQANARRYQAELDRRGIR